MPRKVYELYSVVRTELGLNQFLILLAQRALQPPVLILYWSFLFLAQVGTLLINFWAENENFSRLKCMR